MLGGCSDEASSVAGSRSTASQMREASVGGEVQVQQLPGCSSEGGGVSQQLLDPRPQAPDRAVVDEPAPPLGDVRAKLAAALIAEAPQLTLW
jgi:hypothetical protein